MWSRYGVELTRGSIECVAKRELFFLLADVSVVRDNSLAAYV